MMSDSGKVNNKTYVKILRNRRRRRLMKSAKAVCCAFVNGPRRGGVSGGGGGGGGAGGGCLGTKKMGIKDIASCAVVEKESKIDNFHQLKELKLETSRDQASVSVSSGNSLDGEDKDRTAKCQSHGLISVIGRRRTMEDAVAVALGVEVSEFGVYDFFAVYDGHGGARVANACSDRMHWLVAEEAEKVREAGGGKGLVYWEKVMGKCFDRMDEEVRGNEEVEEGAAVSAKMMGSTAVVVMVGKEEVVVANCGDSRAVLCRGGVAVPLSRDHKVTCHFFSSE